MYRSNRKRLPLLALASVLSLSLMSGCSQSSGTETPSQTTKEAVSEAPETSPSQSAETGGEENTREITDMSGRTVEIPASVDKVFSTGSVAAIYLYTMAPDRLLGWNYDLNEQEKKIILPEYGSLPSFGMGDSVNYEAVIAAAPQIALDVSSGDDASRADADKLSESLGIPVVIVSSRLEDSAEVYRFLGDLLSEPERGEELASYADKVFSDLSAQVIPEDKQVTVYYGNGETSLETAPRGSAHALIFDLIHAVNAADLEAGSGGRVQISAEQLLSWDPDYIIVNGEAKQSLSGDSAAKALEGNPDYASLKAVQNGHVAGVPNIPFGWVDRPPGPNRLIGIKWLAGYLYPDYFESDLDSTIKEFYKLFYHVDLTDDQLAVILYQ